MAIVLQVIVLNKPAPFSIIQQSRCTEDRKHGFLFTTPLLFEKFNSITANSCSVCDHRVVFSQLRQLQEHVRKVHNLYYCDICLEHLKLFPCEHKLYTRHQLTLHRREGDPDDSSHKGHPLCHFCDERFLDKDALFFHLKDTHFWCHICEADGRQDYYANYRELHKHFKEEHFLCEEGQCRFEKLSAVYRSKLDFQAHKAKVHARGLSKAETRQLRQVEIDFQYGREDGGDGMPSVARRYNGGGGRRYHSTHMRFE